MKLDLILVNLITLNLFFSGCALNKTIVNPVELPLAPKAVGNYLTANKAGSFIYINQIALKDNTVLHPGKIDQGISIDQAKEATRQTILNVLSVLQESLDGDLTRVKKCVQISGFFNTKDDFTQHALILNEASQIIIDVFGEAGKHTRGAFGSSSLPLNSSVEIQAIFELW